MGIVSNIFVSLVVLVMVAMNMAFSQYASDLRKKFEEKRLQIVVNYATDAATKEVASFSSDLGQDYDTIKRIKVDPIVAKETFATILLKNYELPVSSTTQENIMLEYVPIFVIAAYDGYYVLDEYVINSSGVANKIFSPKMPYAKEYIEQDGTKSLYSFNLDFKTALKIDSYGNVYRNDAPPLSSREQSYFINNLISDVLNEQMRKYTIDESTGEFFIPSKFTTVGSTNPIYSTTVFAFIDNFDLAGWGTDLQSFGIGGSKIENKDVVVAFSLVVNGVTEYYYAYSDKVPTGAVLIETFDSQKDAASHGYYFYADY